MQKIEFGPLIRTIVIALVFFAIGRFIVMQTQDLGRWIIFAGIIIFYAVWWIMYQNRKKKK